MNKKTIGLKVALSSVTLCNVTLWVYHESPLVKDYFHNLKYLVGVFPLYARFIFIFSKI